MQSLGFWSYALVTGASVALALALTTSFGIRGHADVAVTIGLLAGAVYLITPAAQRDQAKRLWGMVALALGGLMLSSLVGMLFGVGIAFSAIVEAETKAAQQAAPALVLAASVAVAVVGYLAVFRLGWPLVKPRAPVAQRVP